MFPHVSQAAKAINKDPTHLPVLRRALTQIHKQFELLSKLDKQTGTLFVEKLPNDKARAAYAEFSSGIKQFQRHLKGQAHLLEDATFIEQTWQQVPSVPELNLTPRVADLVKRADGACKKEDPEAGKMVSERQVKEMVQRQVDKAVEEAAEKNDLAQQRLQKKLTKKF